MNKFLPSPANTSQFESGEVVINLDKPVVTITGKTYQSVDEYLKDIHDTVYGALAALVHQAQQMQQGSPPYGLQAGGRGALNPMPGNGPGVNGGGINSANAGNFGMANLTGGAGSHATFLIPAPGMGKHAVTATNAGTKQEKKDSGKRNKKAKIVPQAAPPSLKIKIKCPDGTFIYILGDATVEMFDKDPGTVWGNVKLHVAKNAVRAFNAGGKRYIAAFDRKGKFLGYFLNKDMKTPYRQLGTVENMMADDPTMLALENAAKQTGVDMADLETMALIESTGMRTTQNGGLLQVKSGALGQVNKNDKTNISADAIQTDVNTNALIGAKYFKYVTGQITTKDDPNPTFTDKYLAYQQGSPGFKKLKKTVKEAPATKITKNQYDNLPSNLTDDSPGGKKAATYKEDTHTQQQYYEIWTSRAKSFQDKIAEYNKKK